MDKNNSNKDNKDVDKDNFYAKRSLVGIHGSNDGPPLHANIASHSSNTLVPIKVAASTATASTITGSGKTWLQIQQK